MEDSEERKKIAQAVDQYLVREREKTHATKMKKTFFASFAVIALVLSTPYAYGLLTSTRTTENTGIIASVNLGVYKDSSCTQNLTTIDWGVLYPSSQNTYHAYIRNQGTANMTLTKTESNWNPINAPSYLLLSWNYTGQVIRPTEKIHVAFKLTVSPTISAVDTFRFNIIITSTG